MTPSQLTSDSCTGPVLVGTHFLDAPTAWLECRRIQRWGGYLPSANFNRVLDLALWLTRLHRRDIYITQALHLLPRKRKERRKTPEKEPLDQSFDDITRHELRDRKVIPLGGVAKGKCKEWKRRAPGSFRLYPLVRHPSAGGSHVGKALTLADALARATGRRRELDDQRRVLGRIVEFRE